MGRGRTVSGPLVGGGGTAGEAVGRLDSIRLSS